MRAIQQNKHLPPSGVLVGAGNRHAYSLRVASPLRQSQQTVLKLMSGQMVWGTTGGVLEEVKCAGPVPRCL